jgi:phenylpropionate dioxygenase-like ring-hydroxylating dioxygenase large terminal subunit
MFVLLRLAWTTTLNRFIDEQVREFADKITWQDVPIVEFQRPELLPLDLQTELHLRSDRTAIAYRKWLRQLKLTFGTA